VNQTRSDRHIIAAKRLRNILSAHTVASMRILEQKICDSGPFNQRIDPHILTEVRNNLLDKDVIRRIRTAAPWYYLANADETLLRKRLDELDALHSQTAQHDFSTRLGQTLEIATFRALQSQTQLNFFGFFEDLETHDDSTLYRKEEPPSSISGRHLGGGRKLDFLVQHSEAGFAGVETKNVREWLYPNRKEIRELLSKCCALDVVPVLIARRIHFSCFSVLNRCGVIMHQTYNQLYPNSAKNLAEKVSDKTLLGYHDIRLGNEPDARLTKFISTNLPALLPEAKSKFDLLKDVLRQYGDSKINYPAFAELVKTTVVE
jgi:hypothetical protein